MSFNRKALTVGLATMLLVAACGGAATSAPSASPEATETPAATETPTEEPTETPAAVATEEPVGSGAATDLEAMLPGEVNGVAFLKTSFDGSTFPGGIPIGDGDEEFLQFLEDNGKTLEDLRIAIASPTTTETGGSMVMAIQVVGLPGDKFLEFATADMADQKTTIAGKDVFGAAMGGMGAYIYPKGDIVFYVLVMGGEDLSEGIFQQLP